jgi:hypothetical protein
MDIPLKDSFRSASGAQETWLQGRISLYEIVEYFVDDILGNSELAPNFLDRLNVLITTSDEGTIARKANTVEELRDLMLKTTYM